MYPVKNPRKFGSGLAALLAGAALSTGCSPGDREEKEGGQPQAHSQRQAHSQAQAHGHNQGHQAGASGHTQAAPAKQEDSADLGWSKLANGHEHHGPEVTPWEKLAPEVRARLTQQLALTRSLIAKFPNVAAAEAAGYRRQGPFSPGAGAHYGGGGVANRSGTLSDEEILRPSHLIFGGTDKTSPLAGFMYLSFFNGGKGPIEGFAGPYDSWHGHAGVCTRKRPDGEVDTLGFDGSITKEKCEAAGAVYLDIRAAMVHVWTVPAFKSRLGVFSGLNPALKCPDGTYYTEGPAKACRKS
jgi:hypothetical protein